MGKTLHGFALKPPIAVEADRTVFVRVDPEYSTDQGLHSWRVAHRGLWAALHKHGRRVQAVAIARGNRALQRAETVRLHWTNTASALELQASVPSLK